MPNENLGVETNSKIIFGEGLIFSFTDHLSETITFARILAAVARRGQSGPRPTKPTTIIWEMARKKIASVSLTQIAKDLNRRGISTKRRGGRLFWPIERKLRGCGNQSARGIQ